MQKEKVVKLERMARYISAVRPCMVSFRGVRGAFVRMSPPPPPLQSVVEPGGGGGVAIAHPILALHVAS